MAKATLYYAHDPMCSWCYGFNPTWQALQKALTDRYRQDQLEIVYLAGGLAPDSDQPMPSEMRTKLEAIWHRIANELDATFNYEFWQNNTPRRSTYPACRAAILARHDNKEAAMISAIQRAYYREAQNPSDTDVLLSCAAAIGMNLETFAKALNSEETQSQLLQDITLARSLGLNSFPSFALVRDDEIHPIPLDYRSADNMLRSIATHLCV